MTPPRRPGPSCVPRPPTSESPGRPVGHRRAAATLLQRSFGAPLGPDTPARPESGARTNPEAVEALGRIVQALEEARYSPTPTYLPGVDELRSLVGTCVSALQGGATSQAGCGPPGCRPRCSRCGGARSSVRPSPGSAPPRTSSTTSADPSPPTRAFLRADPCVLRADPCVVVPSPHLVANNVRAQQPTVRRATTHGSATVARTLWCGPARVRSRRSRCGGGASAPRGGP